MLNSLACEHAAAIHCHEKWSCKGLQSERLRVLVEYWRIQLEWITGFGEFTAVDVYLPWPLVAVVAVVFVFFDLDEF